MIYRLGAMQYNELLTKLRDGSLDKSEEKDLTKALGDTIAQFLRKRGAPLSAENRQRCWERILEALPTWDGTKSLAPTPWLFAILRSTRIEYQPCKEMGDEKEPPPTLSEDSEEFDYRGMDVLLRLEGCTDEEKEICGFLMQGKTITETAKLVGIGRTTLYERLRGLRERFREIYEDEYR